MTHKRLNYLLISIVSFLFCVLVLSHAVRAESDWSWHVAGYAATNLAYDCGYDPGIGAVGELYGRWKFLELKAHGALMYQHKKHAQTGYTFGYGLEGRGYVWKDFYVLGASKWAGYRSEFEDGRVWEKKGCNYGFGAGYNNGDTDISLSYYLKEHESPNQVQYTTLALRQRIWTIIHGMANLTRQSYDQGTVRGMERWVGWTCSIGVGIRW